MNKFFTLDTEINNQFYQITKVFMMEESKYFTMSPMSKLMYDILVERNKHSLERNWVDEYSRTFLLYKQDELGKIMGIKDRKTVRKYLKELESFGLIYREKQGFKGLDKLYLLQIDN